MNRLTKLHIAEIEKTEIDQLRAHALKLATHLSECAGYIASVRTDRLIRSEGEVFALQTREWAEGAKDIAQRANEMLEVHDALGIEAVWAFAARHMEAAREASPDTVFAPSPVPNL